MMGLWQDARYAARTLARTPGFTAVAVLSLALGIGANTAIFSLLNALVLRTLTVPEPNQLVQFTYTMPGPGPNNWNSWMGYPHFERFRTEAKTFSGIFGSVTQSRLNIGYLGAAGLAQGELVSANFFPVLGISPQHGRFFAEDEDRPDGSVVILSDSYWRTFFRADLSIVGNAIHINRIPFTVIGIAPPEFSGITVGNGVDLWIPLRTLDLFSSDRTRWTASFSSWMLIGGRMKSAVLREQAQAETDVIHRQLIAEQLAASENRNSENMQRFVRESRLVLRSAAGGMFSGLRENYEFPLKLLMGVAGIVLLVACANVANLLLTRASRRRREIAVRLALGAGRARLVRQILTESALLAAAGGTFALAIAWWGSNALVRMISTGDRPVPLDVNPDWLVFGFTAAISLLTTIIFGLWPALRGTQVDPGPAIKEGARSIGRPAGVVDRSLVVIQVALSIALLTGAGLFARTLRNLWNVDLGHDRDNVLMFAMDAKLAGYTQEKSHELYRDLLQRLQSLPQVQAASISVVRPVDERWYLVNVIQEIDGMKLPERDRIRIAYNVLSPGYFSTAATPILLGRDFDLHDSGASPRVVIINESLAKRALPGQNPIGHHLGWAAGKGGAGATIIGVVKDTHYNGVRDQPRPVLYMPLFQSDNTDVSFEMRYRSGTGLTDEVRCEVASIDPSLPIFRVRTLRAQTEQSLLKERLLATLSAFFGGLALLLACLGLYGLMAYAVARRTGEIGIRIALGARRGNVVWMILRETLLLTLAGVACGIPVAMWTNGYAKSLLFGVEPTDPLTFAATAGVLVCVAVLAGIVPARRATRVDPMIALRYE
jgi:predicted permease